MTIKTPKSMDAVVIVPGIMGSELVDEDGRMVWGLNPKVLLGVWASGELGRLTPTDDELAGHPRLRPTRMLRVPAYMPTFGGAEPYSKILDTARSVAVDPRAVIEFPYDWRLPIDLSAALLAGRCQQHLEEWRALVSSQGLGDPDQVRLIVVAHSMGGLVTAYAARVLGMQEILGGVITVGTPYFGALKTLRIMDSGRGGPAAIPRLAARELARRCPGLYDLLPRYRCVQEGGKLRALSAADVAVVGGDRALAVEAGQRWQRLDLADGNPWHPMWTTIIGKQQPTLQSVTIKSTSKYLEHLGGVDHSGDSTVYRDSATPIGLGPIALPQRHGALIRSPEVRTLIGDMLLGKVTGPPLGTRPVGADIPDLVAAGTSVVVSVTGAHGDPVGVTVSSEDLQWRTRIDWLPGVRRGDAVRFTSPDLKPGLHRVQVEAGGFSPVSDIVLVAQESQ